MPSLFEQQEARRQERRDRERERERQEEKLEALREQAREEARERAREEQARLNALEQARAYAAEDERRLQRHLRTRERLRQERRARAREEERQVGRSAAAREAAAAVRRALGLAEAAQQERDAARDRARREEGVEARRQEDRAERRRDDRVQQRRQGHRLGARESARSERQVQARAADRAGERREGQRQAGRASERAAERRDRQRQADRASQRAAARGRESREARHVQSREADRARERGESARAALQAARRDAARAEQRAQDRDEARARQRAEERTAALRRDQAARHRSERSPSGRAAPTALRVLGPLLIDAQDQPVRLRGVELPPVGVPGAGEPPAPLVSEAQLDELVRWGATALAVPVAVDDLLAPPAAPTDPGLLPSGAVEVVPPLSVPDERLLSLLQEHVSMASERGLVTILQLGPLRPPGDDRLVDVSALRLFWRTLAERLDGEPSVMFDVLPGPTTALHPALFRVLSVELIGEVRRVNPAAVLVLESPGGDLPQAQPQLHGLVYGVRVDGDLPPETLAEVATRARVAPVLVLGWGDRDHTPPQDVVGRRLASVGAHWIAGGWPQPASLEVPGRLRATAAGSSVASGLANPDRPVGTGTDGQPADVGRPVTLGTGGTIGGASTAPPDGTGGGGGAGGPGILGAAAMLRQLLIAAVPGPPAAGASLAPPLPASRFLPTAAGLLAALKTSTKADRAAALREVRDDVLVRWNACDAAGLLTVLRRVRAVEQSTMAALPVAPSSLPGIEKSRIVPKFLRERLMLDGRAQIGAELVSGSMTADAAAATPASTAAAVLSLRQLDDVLSRALVIDGTAAATGAERALVAALYRTEGGLGMPPSADSLTNQIPSGTTNEASSLTEGGADVSQLVWISNTTAVTTVPDARGQAIGAFLLQLAGLDVLAGKSWAQFQQWSLDTWVAAGMTPPGPPGAAARTALLQGALVVVKTKLPAVAGSDVFLAVARDPIALTVTAVGEGVQLLRANRSASGFFGVGPLRAGAPTQLSEGMAYLRYNAGDEQARSLLASAVLAAAATKRARWRGLRARIDAPFLASLTTASAAGDAAAAGVKDRKESAKLRSEAVWPALEPWLEQAGNLEALEEFVNEAAGGEWSSGWFTIRANVARFRVLLAFYRRLFTPAAP